MINGDASLVVWWKDHLVANFSAKSWRNGLRIPLENFPTMLDSIMTFASVFPGGGLAEILFFSKRDVFHMNIFFLACLFQVHLAIWAPCVFLTLPYLCF